MQVRREVRSILGAEWVELGVKVKVLLRWLTRSGCLPFVVVA